MTYGEAVNVDEMSAGDICPRGSSRDASFLGTSRRTVITYDDVVLPAGRLADQLRAEQYRKFCGETWLQDLLDGAGAGGAAVPGHREKILV